MRALVLMLALFAAACSTERCKEGTALVSYTLAGGAEAADTIDVTLTLGYGAPETKSVSRKKSDASIEVDFAAYPTGQPLALTLTARTYGAVLASASQMTTAMPGCTAVSFRLDGGASSQAYDDLGGGDLSGAGAGMPVVAPRPIWPVNTGFVTTARPLFKWELSGGDGARVEICKDRACSSMLTSFDVVGASGTPPTALPSQVLFWRLRPMSEGAVLAGVSPTWEFLRGAPTPSTVTSSWGTMLDVNGDGLADLAVGAVAAAAAANVAGPGSAYVFLGDRAAKSSWKTTPPTAAFTLRDPGAVPSDRFGGAVTSAGDLDGDGYGDLAVAASCAPSTTGGCGGGRVYIYRGGPGGLSAAVPAPDVTLGLAGASANTSFGSALAAGDVDGDGYSDLIVAASGNNAVYIIRGGPALFAHVTSVPSWTLTGPAGFGASVANAGDVDGDGYADIVVGSPVEAAGRGSAYLYPGGPSNGFLAGGTPKAVTLLTGDAKANSQLGISVAGAGDTDGDGYTDVIVGADLAPDSTASPPNGNGEAYAYKGSAKGIVTTPIVISHVASGSEELAASVQGVGDVDGNGSDDVVLGAPFFNASSSLSGSGAAYFVSGSRLDLLMAPVMQDAPPTASANFGAHVKFAGDLNGDGFSDIVVGIPLSLSGGDGTQPDFHRGLIAIFFGGASGVATTPDVRILGPDGKNGEFGF